MYSHRCFDAGFVCNAVSVKVRDNVWGRLRWKRHSTREGSALF